jgi:hypothetical protein
VSRTQRRHGDTGIAQLIRDRPPGFKASHFDMSVDVTRGQSNRQLAHDRGRPPDLQIRDQ